MIKSNLMILILLISIQTNAQKLSHNNNIWFHIVEKAKIKGKTYITLEGSLRWANGFEQMQQFFIRPSIDYKFTKSFIGSIGYTYYNTYSYGVIPMNKTSIPEHHLFIQGQYTHKFKDWTISHRLRDENRMVGMAIQDSTKAYFIDHFEYRNRVRYMLSFTYPLLKKNNKPLVNAILADEVFLNIGSFSGESLLNQNRIIAGLSYIFNPSTQLQFSYVHQELRNKSNTLEEINPTLRISFLHNLNF